MTINTVHARPIASFKDLHVWQEGIELVKEVYVLCSKLPKEELYSLAAQMKRAALSVSSNVAEGHSRGHRAEYRQFVFVAIGSLAELETQIIMAEELQFLHGEDTASALLRIHRLRGMLITLARKL